MSENKTVVVVFEGVLVPSSAESEGAMEPERLRPGAENLLRAIADRGYSIILSTSQDVGQLLRWVERNDLNDVVDDVVPLPGEILVGPEAVRFDGDVSKILQDLDLGPFWETEPQVPQTIPDNLRGSPRLALLRKKPDDLQRLRVRLRETEERVLDKVLKRAVDIAHDQRWDPVAVRLLENLIQTIREEGDFSVTDVLRAQAEEYRDGMRIAYAKALQKIDEVEKYQTALNVSRKTEGELRARVIDLESRVMSLQETNEILTRQNRAFSRREVRVKSGLDPDVATEEEVESEDLKGGVDTEDGDEVD